MSLVISSADTKERYSFSKLSSWWTCPLGFKMRYIDHREGEGNAFSSYGSFVHSIMERYAKGEIPLRQLSDVYVWEFDQAVPEKFPYNRFVDLHDTYYRQGLEFLKSFKGYDSYEILGVEEKFELEIDDWIFVGVIDLIYRDSDGNLVILDYKSKASFKSAEEQAKYARQLYLYSIYAKQKYGQYPKTLKFLTFRKQKCVDIEFCQPDADEALSWAKRTVEVIRNAIDYPATCEEFYGNNLCNHRKYCPLKPRKQRFGKNK